MSRLIRNKATRIKATDSSSTKYITRLGICVFTLYVKSEHVWNEYRFHVDTVIVDKQSLTSPRRIQVGTDYTWQRIGPRSGITGSLSTCRAPDPRTKVPRSRSTWSTKWRVEGKYSPIVLARKISGLRAPNRGVVGVQRRRRCILRTSSRCTVQIIREAMLYSKSITQLTM